MGRHDALVKSALNWFLPRPLLSDDWLMLHEPSARPTQSCTAALRIGRMGQANAPLAAFDHLTIRHSFRLFPDAAAPRALLPAHAGRNERSPFIRPRSTDVSPLRRAAAGVFQHVPTTLQLLSTPVDVATETPSEIWQAIEQHVPGGTLGVFLGSRANYARPSVHAFAGDGRPAAIAKIVLDPDGRRRQLHELRMLFALGAIPALAGSVPTPFEYVPGHTSSALITNAFAGEPAPTALSPAMIAWLDRCRFGGSIQIHDSGPVRELLNAARSLGNRDPLLVTILQEALDRVGDTAVPRTVVHGDFVPWNILIAPDGPKVFDWEYADLDGIPGWDLAFFAFQMALTRHDPDIRTLIAEADRLAATPPTPYSVEIWRAVLLLVLIQIMLRDTAAGHAHRVAPTRQTLARLLSTGWLPVREASAVVNAHS